MTRSFLEDLAVAVEARAALLEPPHERAIRLFNGFSEGGPALVVELYGRTIVVHDHARSTFAPREQITLAIEFLQDRLPWLQCGLLKHRGGADPATRQGLLLFGKSPDTWVREHDVRYAVDLRMNRDASFYLDTRNVRRWLLVHAHDRSVLNTFAYTGSLGVAAHAGGARDVVQLDRNARFLDLARRSAALNGWPRDATELLVGDFFPQVSRLKRAGHRFDIVIIDPPFFATTAKGRVDLAADSARLINKVRPLINHGGHLIAINNALFVSGAAYHATLEHLCGDGYLSLEERIDVPEDITGYATPHAGSPVTDPSPFNHATKIAVLSVRRKAD